MIRKQSPDTLRFLFGFIMAVLFYTLFFTIPRQIQLKV